MTNLNKRIATSFILLILFFLILKYQFILAYTLLILGIFSIIEFSLIIKRIFDKKIFFLFSNLIFIFYVSIFSFSFFAASSIVHLKFIIFIILLGCIASDIGGYVFGKILKGPKLTRISPNKTLAGTAGSLILTVLTMSSILLYLNVFVKWQILILSISTSIFCQIGDLFFSYLKRKAKLKDTGKFLPGHGGILDRLDGIFLGLPVGFIIFLFII